MANNYSQLQYVSAS